VDGPDLLPLLGWPSPHAHQCYLTITKLNDFLHNRVSIAFKLHFKFANNYTIGRNHLPPLLLIIHKLTSLELCASKSSKLALFNKHFIIFCLINLYMCHDFVVCLFALVTVSCMADHLFDQMSDQNIGAEAKVLITMISYKCRWSLTVFSPTRFQALIIVHYTHLVTLTMALNLPLNTLGTYNVLNLKSLSYTGFWGFNYQHWGLITMYSQ